MECQSCGAPNEDDASFCKSCGKPMDAAASPDERAPSEQPTRVLHASGSAAEAEPVGTGASETAAAGSAKKPNTVWWVGGGCLILATIALVFCGIGGAYWYYRANTKPTGTKPTKTVRTKPTAPAQQTPAGYKTPEDAVRARVGSTMVLDVRNQTDSSAEVWVGPPNSEFMAIYDVKKDADGNWTVTGQRDIPAEGEGSPPPNPGSGSQAPWLNPNGSTLKQGSPPPPPHTKYPSTGHANAAWMSVGEMFGALKTGNVTKARHFATSNFYSTYKNDFFSRAFLDAFRDFEVRGYDKGDTWNPRVWVRLIYHGGWEQDVIIDTTIETGAQFGAYAAAATQWQPHK